jgi:hypothetical protein
LHDRLGEQAFESPSVEIVHQEMNSKLFGEHLCTTARFCLSRHIIYLGFFSPSWLCCCAQTKPVYRWSFKNRAHRNVDVCTAMGIQEVAAGTPRGPLSAEEDKAFRESIVLLWDVSQVCLETSWLKHICIFGMPNNCGMHQTINRFSQCEPWTCIYGAVQWLQDGWQPI